jgi:murein DD-endopeptidase MepM/ murein hydrolase activator NlpD
LFKKYMNIFFISLIAFFLILPGPLLSLDNRKPFIYPVEGELLTGFRDEYIAEDGSALRHTGIDIQGEPGNRVAASANGIISYTGMSSTGGLTAVIRHNQKIRTTYLNLAGIYVSRGDAVRQGDIIGFLGAYDDISSQKCHLHFGVIYMNSYLDPVQLLEIDYSSISPYLRLAYMEDDFRLY